MVTRGTNGDDADMLAVRPHRTARTYHLPLRILTGLVASTVVLLVASLPTL